RVQRGDGRPSVVRRRAHALGGDGARRSGQPGDGAVGRDQHQAAVHADLRAGSGLAGLGGGLGAEIIAIQPTYPFENLVYFLVLVAVGGLGSLRGPFVAALLIGIADTACKYWLPQFGAFPIYVATIAILLWRPAGLFGRHA